ncbi:NAD(P)H-hydrate dehydratase [Sedimenticola selenatireducens]|uniref:Bifunctional NAD(P)H-hydrate repair enzyme n=1 Tax=Sedimenticola selenatireducens TaxID=191960 RepID=A0A557SF41_9GAMM|nr:NAD(P)H-hydrate dehydratase [Sedimenticola selenatireducens]TVO75962.1 NAD(P)H-hydrate dehydratase [Sedimenticola selenatireducens]TVT63821.1 MAG: NAD(P)H-hydrate dehydratase [Sedimenticola selenatireducens]
MIITEQASLPDALYLAEQVRALDQTAIKVFGIPGATLMERAGNAAFRLMHERWPQARNITLLCGTGNNGGDGYVVARLARQADYHVQVLQVGDAKKITGDAKTQVELYVQEGGVVEPFQSIDDDTDLIVDALLGTGLERAVTGLWANAIRAVNQYKVPVFSLDIPSGLHSDSGRIMGCAIQADATISFIVLKRGMFTGDGPACCGGIAFDDLDVPPEVYGAGTSNTCMLRWDAASSALKPRSRTQHKGQSGHLLLVGGDKGMLGAISLAAQAAARTGAGLISIATRLEHAALIASQRPELMCHGVEKADDLSTLLARADAVVIGPGLGQGDWGLAMLRRVLETNLPLVMDADALNLLAIEPEKRENWVLTPHPGEAARLLGCSTSTIQADRFAAIAALQRRYGGAVLLKGAGTLICSGDDSSIGICIEGNPGMAVGGMGDLLAGVIGSLMAQGEPLGNATRMGACLHGEAGDLAARLGEKGMLASDLLPFLRQLMNPECAE